MSVKVHGLLQSGYFYGQFRIHLRFIVGCIIMGDVFTANIYDYNGQTGACYDNFMSCLSLLRVYYGWLLLI